jgi:hypothetical protein
MRAPPYDASPRRRPNARPSSAARRGCRGSTRGESGRGELHRTAVERPDDWRRRIADVRRVYSGKLTYAVNWHREVEEVSFWDALDPIGVQGYFPLATAAVPTVDELETA